MAMLRSAFAILASFAVAASLAAQSPVKPAPLAKPASFDPERPVAYLHGNIPITMAEFGKYLMDRGGSEKLELFVNRRIIELEAESRKVTVTKAEMEAALAEDLKGIGASQEDFLKILLPRYGKTLYEWMEDTIRPRLLMSKLMQADVKVTDEEMKKQFERFFGEKRVIQMILWPLSEDAKNLGTIRARIINDKNEFDSVARNQPNPQLAASAGRIKPISRYLPGDDKTIEEMSFKLKVGEVSEIMKTQQGYVVLKLNEVIAQDPKVTFETEKQNPHIYKAAFEAKLEQLIPQYFAKLREKAVPQITYTPPSDWKNLPAPASTANPITTPGSGGAPTTIPDPTIRPNGGK